MNADTGGECGRGVKPMIVVGECMFKMSKKTEPRRGPFRRLSDSEILLFVTQTLHPRTSDQETPDFAAKLQALKDIVRQQEIDLLNWPNSPSKDRFYASYLKIFPVRQALPQTAAIRPAANRLSFVMPFRIRARS